MGDRSTLQSSSQDTPTARPLISRDVVIAVGFFGLAMVWVYGSENVSFALRWFAPVTAAHFLAGFLIAKWRILLLPLAVVLASIPVPTPAGADSSTFGEVLFYELFVGVPVVAVGIGTGRWNRGAPFFKSRDPWE
jgi:cytochrome b561